MRDWVGGSSHNLVNGAGSRGGERLGLAGSPSHPSSPPKAPSQGVSRQDQTDTYHQDDPSAVQTPSRGPHHQQQHLRDMSGAEGATPTTSRPAVREGAEAEPSSPPRDAVDRVTESLRGGLGHAKPFAVWQLLDGEWHRLDPDAGVWIRAAGGPMAEHPSPTWRPPPRSPRESTTTSLRPPPTTDHYGSRSESRSYGAPSPGSMGIAAGRGTSPRPSMAAEDPQARQEVIANREESVRVASIAAAVAAAPVAAGVVMQMWQHMQQHLTSFTAQLQMQQLQQQAYNGPPGSAPPSPSPFTPAAAATGGAMMSLPSATATPPGGGFDRGGGTVMTLPSGLPFSVDPWTWQRPQQQQLQRPASPATMDGSSLKAASSGSIQYFGGAGGEVYCCIQGKWFQVKPAGQVTVIPSVAQDNNKDPVVRSIDLTDQQHVTGSMSDEAAAYDEA